MLSASAFLFLDGSQAGGAKPKMSVLAIYLCPSHVLQPGGVSYIPAYDDGSVRRCGNYSGPSRSQTINAAKGIRLLINMCDFVHCALQRVLPVPTAMQ